MLRADLLDDREEAGTPSNKSDSSHTSEEYEKLSFDYNDLVPELSPILEASDKPRFSPEATAAMADDLSEFDPLNTGSSAAKKAEESAGEFKGKAAVVKGTTDTSPAASSDAGKYFDNFNSCLRALDPRVEELIYWRNVRQSGIVFLSLFALLLALACYTLIGLLTNISCLAVGISVCYRLYRQLLGYVQKSDEPHPFKEYLDGDIKLPTDRIHSCVDTVLDRALRVVKSLRKYFLVESVLSSLKFMVVLWLMNVIGSCFTLSTLLLILLIFMFTMPKIYEMHQAKIEQQLAQLQKQTNEIFTQIQAKIPPLPGLKKPTKKD